MNIETHKTTRKWIVAGATLAAAIIAALAYFFPRSGAPPEPNVEVKATGRDAIAAGRDVSIKESTTVDEHDYDADRRRDAEAYLTSARDACASLVEKINALTADSSLDLADPSKFAGIGVEPTQVVAEEYGEKVYAEIAARLERSRKAFEPVQGVLVGNAVMPLMGVAQEKKKAQFDADKKKWLEETTSMCSYLRNVGKGGA